MYPGYGFETTDPKTMKYEEERTFEKSFYQILMSENKKKLKEY